MSIGRLFIRSVGRSVVHSRSIGRSFGLSVGWPDRRSIVRFVDRSVDRSVGRSVYRSVRQSFGFVGRSVVWFIDRSVVYLVGRSFVRFGSGIKVACVLVKSNSNCCWNVPSCVNIGQTMPRAEQYCSGLYIKRRLHKFVANVHSPLSFFLSACGPLVEMIDGEPWWDLLLFNRLNLLIHFCTLVQFLWVLIVVIGSWFWKNLIEILNEKNFFCRLGEKNFLFCKGMLGVIYDLVQTNTEHNKSGLHQKFGVQFYFIL